MAEDKTKNITSDDVKDDSTDVDDVKIGTYTEEQYKAVVSESIKRKKKIDEYEKKLKAIEDEKLTESEKKEKRIKELETENDGLKTATKQTEIDALIVEAISDKNIADKPAMKLLIKKELENEEVINKEVVEKLVDKLIKDNPSRISSNTNVNPSDGNFKKQDADVSKDPDAMFGDFLHSR